MNTIPFVIRIWMLTAFLHWRLQGVRARQEGVTFVTCEDKGLLDTEVRALLGQRVRLQAGAQGVTLARDDGYSEAAAGGGGSRAASKPAASSGAIQKASLIFLHSLRDALVWQARELAFSLWSRQLHMCLVLLMGSSNKSLCYNPLVGEMPFSNANRQRSQRW